MGYRFHLFQVFLLTITFAAGTVAVLPSGKYVRVNLWSDTTLISQNVNTSLASPWGIAQARGGTWWIANSRDGLLVPVKTGTARDSVVDEPVIIPLPRTLQHGLRAKPTGIVYNETGAFLLKGGKPARLIAATQDGIIAAWNGEAGNTAAEPVVDNSRNAVYTGITIARKDGKQYLYAANFRTGTIDIFDTFFHELPQKPRLFADYTLPPGYAPFNVRYIDEKLYVLFALQDADRYSPKPGVGIRYVLVYDMNGRLLQKLEPGKGLESAWEIVAAPRQFGKYAGMLLLGNADDGTIAAIDPGTGSFRGFLQVPEGGLVTVPGVRGMAFGEKGGPGEEDKLYFCAGIEAGEHGLFGFLRPE